MVFPHARVFLNGTVRQLLDAATLFCWHGFNFVRVSPAGDTTFSGALDAIVGLEIHTNMSTTGSLNFGGDGVAGSVSTQAAAVLTGVDSMTRASQLSNVAAYMVTDCPTREKVSGLPVHFSSPDQYVSPLKQ